MKKKILYFLISLLVILSVTCVANDGARYTAINYEIIQEKISNFRKITDFFERDQNYKKLIKRINNNEKNKNIQVLNVSEWVYKNINKINHDEGVAIIDSHPWTIVERKMGVNDQFSDILSVLLVYSGIDSFFMSRLNKTKHPITFFKQNNNWSLIDPYYGIYFLNDAGKFCNIDQHRQNKCIFYHLEFGKISDNLLNKTLYKKKFENLVALQNYYYFLFKDLPSAQKINNTNIYNRGGRSYIQKPIHRFIYQIRVFFKFK